MSDTITREKFNEFVMVQASGVCNMLDYQTISELTTLTRDEHMEIISNYSAYNERFGGEVVRGERDE